MTIAELRRKINDSRWGEKVNNSIPGILVEGLSREVSDAMTEVKYKGMMLGASFLVGIRKPLAGLVLGGMTLVEKLADRASEIDPKNHYSHKSPLYEMITDTNGENVMRRVSVEEALLEKIAQYSPRTALTIALVTAQPKVRYG